MTLKNNQYGFTVIELMFVLAVMAALTGVLLLNLNRDHSVSIEQFKQEIQNAVFLARKHSLESISDVSLTIDCSNKQFVISWTDDNGKLHSRTSDFLTKDVSDCKFYYLCEIERKKLKSRERNSLNQNAVIVRSKYCQPFELSFKIGTSSYSLFVDRFCQMTSTFPESMLYGK